MIISTGNARIRALIRLKKSRKERRAADCFLVEGPKMFREIPEHLLIEAYASESFLRTEEGRRLAEGCGVQVEAVADSVFQYLSDTQSPQGVLAVVRQMHYGADVLLAGGASGAVLPLILILENLQDPGNLGTILRTAEAAGATGILLSASCADITNPKVTRSTMGSIFRVPFCYTQDLAGDIRLLQQRGVQVLAAHLKGAVDLYEADCTGPTAFLIGNESRGLTEETAVLADRAVRIPMSGQVESLNAAVAASILMYEARRQRR